MTAGSSTQAHWKIADSGDLGNLAFSFLASRNCGIVMLRITGAHATDPLSFAAPPLSLDPPNLAATWGVGNYIGITLLGMRHSAAAAGTVTPPAGTSLIVSSPPNQSSTIIGQSYAATTNLTGVSSWNPAVWAVSGTSDIARPYTVLIRPA